MLPLVDQQELLKSLPVDASPTLARLITVCTSLKNLQTLACDAELSLAHVNKFFLYTLLYKFHKHNMLNQIPKHADTCTNIFCQ